MGNNINSRKHENYILLLLLFPILMWFVWLYWGCMSFDAESLSALFSGLAFGGLIIGLYYQKKELRNQREDLQLQRIDLKIQIDEIKDTRKVLQDQEIQLREQTKLIEQQFLNQRISRIEENIQRLLQGYIQVIHGLEKVLENRSIQHEGLNLCNIILDSFEKFKEHRDSNEFFFKHMDNVLKNRDKYAAAELSLSFENVLVYYDSIVTEKLLPETTINNFLILIKSHLPLYLRCYFFYFAKSHSTGDTNIVLKELITKYLLDDFDDIIMRFIICQNNESKPTIHLLYDGENYRTLQSLLREIIDSK